MLCTLSLNILFISAGGPWGEWGLRFVKATFHDKKRGNSYSPNICSIGEFIVLVSLSHSVTFLNTNLSTLQGYKANSPQPAANPFEVIPLSSDEEVLRLRKTKTIKYNLSDDDDDDNFETWRTKKVNRFKCHLCPFCTESITNDQPEAASKTRTPSRANAVRM